MKPNQDPLTVTEIIKPARHHKNSTLQSSNQVYVYAGAEGYRSLEHEHGGDHGGHREHGLREARADLGRGAGRRRRRRGGTRGGLLGGKDVDPDLHAVLAVRADAADEPPAAGLAERDLVLAGGEHLGVLRLGARLEVGAADLHHRVAGLAVLEHCKRADRAINTQALSPRSGGDLRRRAP